MNRKPDQAPRNLLPDCIIPALAAAFTVYYLTTITEVPWISQASALVVGMLLLLAITAFVIRSIVRIRRGVETIRVPGALRSVMGEQPILVRRAALLALTIAYVWLIDQLGFTVTTFLFIFCSIVLLSSLRNWARALTVSLACSAIGYLVFIQLFKTRFPFGPLEHWLKSVL